VSDDGREQRRVHQEWHVAVNRLHLGDDWKLRNEKHRPWMYEALSASNEIRRLPLLFRAEHLGQLRATHQQCSHAEAARLWNQRTVPR
jgi:hypothetical protein